MQPCLLIIDDDPLVRDALARLTRSLGYKALEANNGPEALELLGGPTESGVDLVLSDIMMPRMSGIELLQAVHEIKPDLPVAMITGAATLDNSIAALNLGAYAYLIKPVRGEQLREVVTKGLRILEQIRVRQRLEHEFAERYKELQDQIADLQESHNVPVDGSEIDPLADLIRGLRHELGNAATAMKLNLSVLEQEGNNSGSLQEHLRDLETTTYELISLVGRLKQYPKQRTTHDLIDVRQTLINLGELATDKLVQTNIKLDLTLPEEDVYVYGMDIELLRVCNHILDNAIEATAEAGGRRVQVIAAVAGDDTTITFEDEGRGFPDEMLEELFSPGYTTKITGGVVRGLGLGLFIARSTVNLYGGTIALENRQKGGASVKIQLPQALVGRDEPPAASAAAH